MKMKTADLKNESTLAAASKEPEEHSHSLIFAVVVDISSTMKFEEGSNFVTQLKIIDPSFNYKAKVDNPELRFFKFCHVNIYTETPEAAPKVSWIGDIVRLRRFKFKISSRGELQAFERVKFSNWLFYSGERTSTNAKELPISFKKDYPKNENRVATPYERGRLNDLRDWAHEFFSRSSVRYIIWWNDINFKAVEEQKAAVEAQNVDLLLKVSNVSHKDNKLTFTDIENRQYILQLGAALADCKNKVIKLRCVNVRFPGKKGGPAVITQNDRTSCLFLRPHCRDALAFDADKRKAVGKKLYLLEFNSEKKGNFITDIKRYHNKLTPTSASSLLQILTREPELHLSEKFIFEGRVAGLETTDPAKIIRKQESKFEETKPLSASVSKKYQIIYHLQFSLQDESTKERLPVYLTTFADSYYMFDEWGVLPPTKDNEAWNKIKPAQLAKFSEKLELLVKKAPKVRFVLQLFTSASQKPYFAIVDTLFHDF